MSASELLKAIKLLATRGEQLAAYDLSVQALAQYPGDLWIKHQAVLSLARAGATHQAMELFEKLELDREGSEDIRALKARLLKDHALSYPPEDRARHFLVAAAVYEQIYQETHGYYPGINAATLYFLAGNREKSHALAEAVLMQINGPSNHEMPDAYYREATRAEAQFLLGDLEGVRKHILLAKNFAGDDYSAVATTRKQFRLLFTEDQNSLLSELKNPKVIHYSGHLIDPPGAKQKRFAATDEGFVRAQIDAFLRKNEVKFGFGSLANGSDILFAEALLDCDASLEIYLPFCIEDFLQISVLPGGPEWQERFHRVIAKATRVSFATEDQYLKDDSLFTYCSQLAMGQAILRAQHLETDVLQVTVWDGKPAVGIAGTAIDILAWNKLGFPQEIIKLPCFQKPAEDFFENNTLDAKRDEGVKGQRVLRAILFGDIKGFSKLHEAQINVFVDEILGLFGHVLDGMPGKVLFRNTWGDGIFVILPDVLTAAECAIKMQKQLAQLIEQKKEFANHALRLGAHFGPVIEKYDPVLKKTNYFGVHVSRAARVEPVTPPGKVYATWPFASQIAILKNAPVRVDYVGDLPAAKSYGHLQMYVLTERHR